MDMEDLNQEGSLVDKYISTNQVAVEHHEDADCFMDTSEGLSDFEYRVVALQSAPLAYIDRQTGAPFPLRLPELDNERRLLEATIGATAGQSNALRGTVEFEPATMSALQTHCNIGGCSVLQISGQGHPDYLALEDGNGLLLPVSLDEVIASLSFVSTNRSGYQQPAASAPLIILAINDSQRIGQAFLQTGARHVICRQGQVSDEAASEFIRVLYSCLFLKQREQGTRIQDSFIQAREAVRVVYGDTEAANFRLLPDTMAQDDPYHDIPISPTASRSQGSIVTHLPSSFDLWSQPRIIGREDVMFDLVSSILRSTEQSDAISLRGPHGIGKTAVVVATCKYILERKCDFAMESLFYISSSFEVFSDNDIRSTFGRILMDIMRIIHVISEVSNQEEEHIEQTQQKLVKLLALTQKIVELLRQCTQPVILVVDAYGACTSTRYLQHFFNVILGTGHVRIVAVVPTGVVVDPLQDILGANVNSIEVPPLDYFNSVALFGSHCPHVSNHGGVVSLDDFTTIFDAAYRDPMTAKNIHKLLGDGNPKAILAAAERLSRDDLVEILRMARVVFRVDAKIDLAFVGGDMAKLYDGGGSNKAEEK